MKTSKESPVKYPLCAGLIAAALYLLMLLLSGLLGPARNLPNGDLLQKHLPYALLFVRSLREGLSLRYSFSVYLGGDTSR